jgi:hypothetical protein
VRKKTMLSRQARRVIAIEVAGARMVGDPWSFICERYGLPLATARSHARYGAVLMAVEKGRRR